MVTTVSENVVDYMYWRSRVTVWKHYLNPNEYGGTMSESTSENYNFDFDIGYLVKSPCRDCVTQDKLPDCIQKCEILDKIQHVLADSISSESSISNLETYDVPSEILEQI